MLSAKHWSLELAAKCKLKLKRRFNMKNKILIAFAIAAFSIGGVIASTILATDHNHSTKEIITHSGGTDSMGCHTDSRTGYWHCH